MSPSRFASGPGLSITLDANVGEPLFHALGCIARGTRQWLPSGSLGCPAVPRRVLAPLAHGCHVRQPLVRAIPFQAFLVFWAGGVGRKGRDPVGPRPDSILFYFRRFLTALLALSMPLPEPPVLLPFLLSPEPLPLAASVAAPLIFLPMPAMSTTLSLRCAFLSCYEVASIFCFISLRKDPRSLLRFSYFLTLFNSSAERPSSRSETSSTFISS
jgi:hypothetical protein